MIEVVVADGLVGERLDAVATQHVPVSRAFIQKLCNDNKISVNGNRVKTSYKLRAGDKLQIDYDPSELEQIPDIELPILYEDDGCVVINKPIGVLTHSKGAFNPEATVATWLRQHILEHKSRYSKVQPSNNWDDVIAGNRAGVVHRLDRATSGVMICAKNPAALSWLQKQFSQRKVKKTYGAIVAGRIEPEHAMIDMPIERNPKAPATFRVGANGKSATTEYLVDRTNARFSLVTLKPTTGRTHQLRVHLKQLGHPIIGDTLYGGEPAERLFLHALSLEITLPNRERKIFTAPLPDEFNQKLEQLGE